MASKSWGGTNKKMKLVLVDMSCLVFLIVIVAIPLGTAQEYSYDPTSSVGPSQWGSIPDANAVRKSPYFPYASAANHPIHDIDFNGNECSSAYRPSPLHLTPTADRPFAECIDRHEMLTRKIDADFTCTPYDTTFEITPHTLKMHLPSSDDPTDPGGGGGGCIRPRINLSGNFPEEFIMHWLEIHLRSEHVVDGKRYDGEMQMVHFGQGEDDYMATTVSVLLEATARTDHKEFQWLLDQWQKVADDIEADCGNRNGNRLKKRARTRRMMSVEGRDELMQRRRRLLQEEGKGGNVTDAVHATLQTEDEYRRAYYGQNSQIRNAQDEDPIDSDPSTNADEHGRRAQYGDASCRADKRGHGCPGYGKRRKQFPYTLWPTIYYYGYRGSITAPPCTDVVNWRILDVPLLISKRQFQQLARLLDSYRDGDCRQPQARTHETEADSSNSGSGSKVSPTGENYRPLQPQGAADIFHCSFRDFRPFMYLPEDQ